MLKKLRCFLFGHDWATSRLSARTHVCRRCHAIHEAGQMSPEVQGVIDRICQQTSLWVVGQYIADAPEGGVWELQGVFNTEQKAEDACINPRYFLYRILLNQPFPEESITPGDDEDYRWAGFEKACMGLSLEAQQTLWQSVFGNPQ